MTRRLEKDADIYRVKFRRFEEVVDGVDSWGFPRRVPDRKVKPVYEWYEGPYGTAGAAKARATSEVNLGAAHEGVVEVLMGRKWWMEVHW